ANSDECVARVTEEIFAAAHSVVSAAYTAEDGWLAGIRSALGSLLGLIDEQPHLARIWFVDAMAAPEAVRQRRAAAAAMLVAVVEVGRSAAGERRQPSELTAEAIVGGISQIIHTRLLNGSRESFVELLGPCMYLIVLPYLGVARARAELRRAPPIRREPAIQRDPAVQREPAVQVCPSADDRRPRTEPSHRTEPLRDTNLRLTHRTVRALDTISGRPGASNRTVAEESGIKDQGQVSKLLWRLERFGLIENRGLGRDRGASNAWHITTRGLEILRATNVHQFMRFRGTARP
ncbi:MAG TPA: hypothetical protein VK680_14705, partial [Solirubrobacteraceae bacterium]|nr:hypothetical protein [Solirubrobacteraceae bacterium]